MRTKNLMLGAIAAAMLLGSAGIAGATDDARSMDKGANMGMDKGATMGMEYIQPTTITVKNIDKANKKVTFEADVKPDASILKDGQPVALDQLKEGDSVRASFDPATGDVNKLEILKAGEQPLYPQTQPQPQPQQ